LPKKPKGNVVNKVNLDNCADYFKCSDTSVVPIQIGGECDLSEDKKTAYYFRDLRAVSMFLEELREQSDFFMEDMEMQDLYFCKKDCEYCAERFEKLLGYCTRGLVLLAAVCNCGKTELVIKTVEDVPKIDLICPHCQTILVKYG